MDQPLWPRSDAAPVESITVGHLITTLDGTILSANPTVAHHFKTEPESLVGQSIEQLFAPMPSSIISRIVEVASASDEPQSTELGAIRPNGETFWARIVVFAPVRPNDEQVVHLLLRNVTENRTALESAAQSDLRYSDMVDFGTFVLWEVDARNFEFTYVSQNIERCFGYPAEAWFAPEFWASRIHPDERDFAVNFCQSATRGLKDHEFEYRFLNGAGEWVWVRDIVKVTGSRDGPEMLRGVMFDITSQKIADEERKRLETRLSQSQKIESVGLLAGGVAHDFNNMLSVIMGHAELALLRMDPSDPSRNDLLAIQHAANRSSNLTRQLLAYARQQPIVPRIVHLNDMLGRSLAMLERLIGESVRVITYLAPGDHAVCMDPTQLDQILTNLFVNARDAMAGVGRITLATILHQDCHTLRTRFPQAKPGRFVQITVQDTGSGIDPSHLPQIFDPFFTTKGFGEGTGLGLSMVHGAVVQNGGFIDVETEVRVGTRFHVFLPLVDDVPSPTIDEPADPQFDRGHRTIVLVEDEIAILDLAQRMLELQGYEVICCSSPSEALTRISQVEHIDLLITDVVMPVMNGKELYGYVSDRFPSTACLYISGYSSEIISQNGIVDDGAIFLTKPFTMKELVRKVSEVLGS